MKPLRHLSLLPLGTLLIASSRAADLTWNGNPGDLWDTATAQWLDGPNPAAWNSATPDRATFGSTGAGTIQIGSGISANRLAFESAGYSLEGNAITLAGSSPTITTQADATIASILAGSAGLVKTGTGTLTLGGTNTYTGATTLSAGTLGYAGTGGNSNGQALLVGAATGRATLLLQSTGTFTYGTSGGDVRVGGNNGAADTGAGAVRQSAGTVTLARNNAYLELGAGGNGNTYGSYDLSGGSLTIPSGGGIRVGFGGVGSFVQSGGTLNVGRWFAIGAGNANGHGAVTFTGGTAVVNPASGWRFLVGDATNARATLNLGTQAGGDAVVTNLSTSGITLRGDATATLNLNSGTLVLGGAIQRSSGAAANTVNLNGGTLRTGVNNATLLSNANGLSANVYNGGLTVDTQNFNSTLSANLLAPAGNGIYTSGGVIALPAPAGEGYLGAPLVTVTGGSGSGAGAIANIDAASGKITGITLTSPGQGYQAGDTLSFTFAGGGFSSAADPFQHQLSAADLSANGSGGLTKTGSGQLMLTGTNTFTGPITIQAGRLDANTSGNGGLAVNAASKISVENGGQFLGFTGTYTTGFEIAGNGHGETGYPGALRAAANTTATFSGDVLLTADATIMAQRGATINLTGSLGGAHTLRFHVGDPVTSSGTILVAPAAASPNAYAATVITGSGTGGAVVAGNENAFSSGPLTVDNASLRLNGHSFSFASLSGSGGTLGNFAETAATLSVGADGSSSTSATSLVDGGSGALGLTKQGSGTLTLTGNSTYTGATLVSAGTLLVNGSLGNTTVTVENGAALGGIGSLAGAVHFLAGASLVLTSLETPLSLAGPVTFASFGFGNLLGWDYENAETGIYTVLAGDDFDLTNVSQVGPENAITLGNGNQAYFRSGSLQVVIIPEPSAACLALLGALSLLRRKR